MSGLSSSHLEGVQQSSKYCALRIPPVQESFSTRVVNSKGKQDLNRSPQEDKYLENDRWRCIGKVLQAISLKVFIFFVCYKEVIFHLVQIHLIIYIQTCHSGHLNIHDQNICIDFCSYKKIFNISQIINTFVGICRAERKELLYIKVKPYIAQDVSNLQIVMATISK